jgi:hypothetical protein
MGNVLSKISKSWCCLCCCGKCNQLKDDRETRIIYERIKMESEMYEKTQLI